jgi:hypothetical protein
VWSCKGHHLDGDPEHHIDRRQGCDSTNCPLPKPNRPKRYHIPWTGAWQCGSARYLMPTVENGVRDNGFAHYNILLAWDWIIVLLLPIRPLPCPRTLLYQTDASGFKNATRCFPFRQKIKIKTHRFHPSISTLETIYIHTICCKNSVAYYHLSHPHSLLANRSMGHLGLPHLYQSLIRNSNSHVWYLEVRS